MWRLHAVKLLLIIRFSRKNASFQKQSSGGVLERPATSLKTSLWHRYFPVHFAKFLRAPFLTEHLRWLLPSFKIIYSENLKINLFFIYLTKRNPLKYYRKYFPLHIKCFFGYQDIIIIFLIFHFLAWCFKILRGRWKWNNHNMKWLASVVIFCITQKLHWIKAWKLTRWWIKKLLNLFGKMNQDS